MGLSLVGLGAGVAQGQPVITEFSAGITVGAGPALITSGPDGNLWFTENTIDRIGRITPLGVVSEFSAGITAGASPLGIAAGADGNLWFTEPGVGSSGCGPGDRVGRITSLGVVSEFSSGITACPFGVTTGPDGNLWFTEGRGDRIGRLTPLGVVSEFSAGITAGSSPAFITTGPDGNLWFTEARGDRIGRITPLGVVTEFSSGLTAGAEPFGITTGPDGNLWFTETTLGASDVDKIGRITPLGVVTEFSSGITAGAGLAFITTGPDGNLWFTEGNVDRIGQITPLGVVTEFSSGITSGAGLFGIATGPDGNLWFTEATGSRIGRISGFSNARRCASSSTTLCIDDQPGDERWQATVSFSTTQGGGRSGNGEAIPLARLGVSHGGLFWFFGADNPEMLLKVINACALNQHFWVFYSATTNVGFTVTIKDTRNGHRQTYSNNDGKAAAPIQDTSAFACTGGDAGPASEDGSAGEFGDHEAANDIAAWGERDSSLLPSPEPAANGGCSADTTTLCIDGRFKIQATFQTTQGGGKSGSGQGISLQSLGVAQGGLFWFFSADNPEMLVKVINACTLNNKFWVFYAAGTNVGFTVTVTDTQTDHQAVYHNKDLTAALPVQDTSALTCP